MGSYGTHFGFIKFYSVDFYAVIAASTVTAFVYDNIRNGVSLGHRYTLQSWFQCEN